MGGQATHTSVEVDGRRLRLSNLDKVLCPDTGTTKAEVEAARRPEDLTFTADAVLARVETHGGLFAPLLPAPG
jgi:hypothetical protein